MSNDEETTKTDEGLLLEKRPEIKANLATSREFNSWKSGLKRVVIDGEAFYVRGGDQLKDEDQIMVEWARRVHPSWLNDGKSEIKAR